MDEKIQSLIQLGTTWWGKSWIKNMLKHGRFYRMQRGIIYSKEHRVSNVIIKKGEVFALCQGTAPVPYRVRIEFTPIVSKQWRDVIVEMGQSIEIEAKLISGEMPEHINKLFLRNGVPLFPVPKQQVFLLPPELHKIFPIYSGKVWIEAFLRFRKKTDQNIRPTHLF